MVSDTQPTTVQAKLPHPDMLYRFLGNSGLKISVISLGGWLNHGGLLDDNGAVATIKAAYDGGVNFFDTAEEYNGGQAEVVLGKAIKHLGYDREDLVISTKLYWGRHEDGSLGINGAPRRGHFLAMQLTIIVQTLGYLESMSLVR